MLSGLSAINSSAQSRLRSDAINVQDALLSSNPQTVRDTISSARRNLERERNAAPIGCCQFYTGIICCPILSVIAIPLFICLVVPLACIYAPFKFLYDLLCCQPHRGESIFQDLHRGNSFVPRLSQYLDGLSGSQTVEFLRNLRTASQNLGFFSIFSSNSRYNTGYLPKVSQLMLIEIVANREIEPQLTSGIRDYINTLRSRYDSLSLDDKTSFRNDAISQGSEGLYNLQTDVNSLCTHLRQNDCSFKNLMRSAISAYIAHVDSTESDSA